MAETIGLALSGGGYRATLFHVGALWRLNELGFLPRLSEISSVSGGSIAAGMLGLRWKRLRFDANGVASNFDAEVAAPLRAFCRRTIDLGAVVRGWLHPFRHPSDYLTAAYDRHLFHGATLRDLPTDAEGPRFTLYATSLQTGASVRFSRPYMAEYHLGQFLDPEVPLAVAVAASSAFPPLFCPLVLKTDPARWVSDETADLAGSVALRSRLLLGDGGIYDNLGLERIADRHELVLVSDAGAPFAVKERGWLLRVSQLARTKRVLDIAVEQTRALRRRRLVGDLEAGTRRGAYWGISTVIAGYELQAHGRAAPIVCDSAATRALARVRTRLNAFDDGEQAALINWGYALSDAALRRYVLSEDPPAGRVPLSGAMPTVG